MSEDADFDPLATHPVVQTWRFWLTHLLGWNEEQVLAFAERFREEILDDKYPFNHETPEFWIAGMFVPKDIRDSHPPMTAEQVSWTISPALEKYGHTYGMSTEHLDTFRAQLNKAIEERYTKLTDPLLHHPVVESWRFWLTHLLGWKEEEIDRFAEQWRDEFKEKDSLFYSEIPEYWISRLLVPPRIAEEASGWIVFQITWVIYPVLEKYRLAYGLIPDHLDRLKLELKDAIETRYGELTKAD